MQQLIVPVDGVDYIVEYDIYGDELTVFLPDGVPRTTTLNGLGVKSAVAGHVRQYFRSGKQLALERAP